MQRVHQDDLVGYLQEQGGFDVLNFPAIAQREETYELGDAMSESVRSRVIEWYRSTLLSRGDDKKSDAHRRLHATGASGRSGRLPAGARRL